MNLTIGNSKLKTSQTLKTRYIAAAGGLALAAAAITGISSLDKVTTASAPAPVRSATSISVPQRGPSEHTIYIVASQQEATDLQASVMQDLDPSRYAAFTYLVASDAESTAWAQNVVSEAAREETGTSISVVDKTGLVGPAPLGPVTSAKALSPTRFLPTGPGAVTFYLVANQAAADQALANEELAQWIRHDNNVPEPSRAAVTLIAGTSEQEARALKIVTDAMAAANFSDANPAPSFNVVDLR